MSQETINVTNIAEDMEIKPIRLKKGDTLIVMLHDRKANSEVVRLREQWKSAFPDNDIVVIFGTADFAVIRQGEQPPNKADINADLDLMKAMAV